MSVSVWRAILLVWGLSLISPPTELIAGTLTSSVDRADEPFGLSTSMVTTGPLLEKWLDVERNVDDERRVLRICEENRASCQSQTALQFLAIVDGARTLEGRARLGQINCAINLKIKSMSDLTLYGAEDVWSPPLATLAKGAGDCEDYAIAKFVALQEAGVSADDLRIVILRDDIREEDHAVVAARLDGKWLMLDNLHMVMAASAGLLPPRRHDTFVDIGFDQDVGLAVGCGARHRPDVQRRMRPGRLSEIFDAAGNVTFGNPRKLDRRDKVFGTLLRR